MSRDPRSMKSYDFIVVGAGAAGCVIAARLSEDDGARVLLLEAGTREPLPAMGVPAAWPSLLGSSADWNDTTVTQAATGMTMPSERGRGLGGSSGVRPGRQVIRACPSLIPGRGPGDLLGASAALSAAPPGVHRTVVSARRGTPSSRQATDDRRLGAEDPPGMADNRRVIYTAHAQVTGGRAAGHGRTSDGALEVDLRVPPEMGGEAGGTNPEQLFAVGYAACFESALGAVGRRRRLEVADVAIDSSVMLIPTQSRWLQARGDARRHAAVDRR